MIGSILTSFTLYYLSMFLLDRSYVCRYISYFSFSLFLLRLCSALYVYIYLSFFFFSVNFSFFWYIYLSVCLSKPSLSKFLLHFNILPQTRLIVPNLLIHYHHYSFYELWVYLNHHKIDLNTQYSSFITNLLLYLVYHTFFTYSRTQFTYLFLLLFFLVNMLYSDSKST